MQGSHQHSAGKHDRGCLSGCPHQCCNTRFRLQRLLASMTCHSNTKTSAWAEKLQDLVLQSRQFSTLDGATEKYKYVNS